ncbi:MAG TPA: F0F1 ATP synthase subunit epsilon [Candidatus Dormibacteraeota bacterium]|nr:F0F1 ATP synthase subunit epsilon [Candidatus Dormibacteraeota bacterium]
MPESIALEVVTPDRRVVQETVDEVQVPGSQGYIGALPGHAPLMTELGIGMLSYRKGASWSYLTAIGGFAEVLADRVIVLAEEAERAEEIDVERAREAMARAQGRLAKMQEPEIDWERAQTALQRALVRVQVAAKTGGAVIGHPHPKA